MPCQKITKGQKILKDKLFSKIVKKDYNNNLEEILSKKDFSEEVKNTLLTMFYKIENGYKDYTQIKRQTFDKQEYIEKLIHIIDKDCEKIEFIAKNSNQQETVDKEKKEIICLPIENKILYSLAKIQKRNIVVKYIDESIEKAFTFMLNTGNNINIVEPLRDFNGFSWNTIVKHIEDVNCNLMYQNIIFLVGNKFVDKWVNNYEPLVDYFDLFQSEIEKKYGKKIKENILTDLLILSIKLKIKYDEDFKEEIKHKKEKLEKEKTELENKENYLTNLAQNKKQKEKEIKQIDQIINSKNLLAQEYQSRNEKLPLEKKIFSIRVLKNNLKKERERLLQQIEEDNKQMNPKIFLEKKNEIQKNLKYFDVLDDLDLKKQMISLQKETVKCMYVEVERAEEKNALIDLIYQYRYYCFLPIDSKMHLYEVKELKKSLDRLTKKLIQKAIDRKVINKISDQDEINFSIIQQILLSKIITLEDIYIKFTKGKEGNQLTIYDEAVEDRKVEIPDIKQEEIKIKWNKKTKLFI